MVIARRLAVLALPFAAACSRPVPPPSAPRESAAEGAVSPAAPTFLDIPARQGPADALVVLLHGLGDSAAGFLPVARALGGALPRAELLVPDGFHPFEGGGRGRQWFSFRGLSDANQADRVARAAGEVSRWIGEQRSTRGIAPSRLAVVGFSQGAMIGAFLAMHGTPRPAAVVLFSGRTVDEAPAPAGAFPTQVLVAHGDRDGVIPPASVDTTVRALASAGDRVTRRLYPGLAHRIDTRELRDAVDFLQAALGTGARFNRSTGGGP